MAMQGVTMPPPYAGLDLLSPIDNMDPNYALELVNVFPGSGTPSLRKGYYAFADLGQSTPVATVRELVAKTGISQLIVANNDSATPANNKMYAISEAGVVTDITPSAGASPPGSGVFQTAVYANNVYLCNGVSNALVYTGSGDASPVTFTGVSLSDLINVSSFRERLYFIEKNTLKVWYGGTSVTGTGGTPALTSFDLQYVMRQGGFLLHAGSFTNANGMTAQDLFFACSSEGELVFYTGSSPADTQNWAITARFVIGKPLGYRAFIRVNNDIWILTQQGIVPMSALFQADPEQALRVVSERINPLISQYAQQIPFSPAWGGFMWTVGRRVFVSVPTSSSDTIFLVYSLDTKGWTKYSLFSTQHGVSSCSFDDLPIYASSTGIIYLGETGYADAASVSDAGQNIAFEIRTPFSFYGSRGNYKAFKDIRPILRSRRGTSFSVGIDTDFKRQPVITPFTTPSGSFTAWGSPWGSPWSAEIDYIFDRYAARGQGHCAAIRFGGSLRDTPCDIFSFEIRFDVGGQV